MKKSGFVLGFITTSLINQILETCYHIRFDYTVFVMQNIKNQALFIVWHLPKMHIGVNF